jgi:hypothetical protein
VPILSPAPPPSRLGAGAALPARAPTAGSSPCVEESASLRYPAAETSHGAEESTPLLSPFQASTDAAQNNVSSPSGQCQTPTSSPATSCSSTPSCASPLPEMAAAGVSTAVDSGDGTGPERHHHAAPAAGAPLITDIDDCSMPSGSGVAGENGVTLRQPPAGPTSPSTLDATSQAAARAADAAAFEGAAASDAGPCSSVDARSVPLRVPGVSATPQEKNTAGPLMDGNIRPPRGGDRAGPSHPSPRSSEGHSVPDAEGTGLSVPCSTRPPEAGEARQRDGGGKPGRPPGGPSPDVGTQGPGLKPVSRHGSTADDMCPESASLARPAGGGSVAGRGHNVQDGSAASVPAVGHSTGAGVLRRDAGKMTENQRKWYALHALRDAQDAAARNSRLAAGGPGGIGSCIPQST